MLISKGMSQIFTSIVSNEIADVLKISFFEVNFLKFVSRSFFDEL